MKSFAFFAVLFSYFASFPVFAAGPALVEMFGSSYKCQASEKVQDSIENIIRENPDVVFLNCRLKMPAKGEDPELYGQDFCNEGRLGYIRDLGIFSGGIPFVIVNGRYEASLSRVDLALKAAYSLDDIQKIEIHFDRNNLEISIPDITHEARRGELYLYGYAPLENGGQEYFQPVDSSTGEIDGDTYIVTNTGPRVYRPVVWMKKVADWEGHPFSMTVPLSEQGQMYGFSPAELGYVAVLHQGAFYSPIVAVGELKILSHSTKSMSEILPMTLPAQNLETSLVPDKDPPPVTLPNQ